MYNHISPCPQDAYNLQSLSHMQHTYQHIFGVWKETKGPVGNPHKIQGGVNLEVVRNMQTLYT